MINKKVFIYSLIVLICAGCSKSTDKLIKDLYSDNNRIRFESALALQRRKGDEKTLQKVISILDDDNDRVVFIASQILGSLEDTLAIKPLGKLIDHSNSNIRARACLAMGSIKDASALPYILKGLKDPESGVRYAAVIALGLLEYLPAQKHIYPMSRDTVDSVRVVAVQSLYRYRKVEGSNVMASDFAASVVDKNDRVRYVAVQALGGKLEEKYSWSSNNRIIAGNLLIEALKDENLYVRIEAINSLRMLRYKKAVPVLEKMYETASVDEEVIIEQAIKEITGDEQAALK